jgi:acyl-ACP thioesterase
MKRARQKPPGGIGKNVAMQPTTPAFRPEPASGRVYGSRRLVRSTDVTPAGRLRLDALARYLQAVAEDDLADSGLLGPVVWLVRRCSVVVLNRAEDPPESQPRRGFPLMSDRLELRTFCSGTGPRWAERTTTVSGEAGELLQATAVWAAVGRDSGRPVALGDDFMRVYGESAQGRAVSVRLSHPRPDGSAASRPWPLRAADFDTAGHVNNAVAWAAVEDLLASAGWLPGLAEVEYHRAIMPGCQPLLAAGEEDSAGLRAWLLAGGHVLASARLAR